MKTKNLLFSGAIALSTILSPTAALLNSAPVFAETVTMDPTDWGADHTFEAYQIFAGTQGTDGVLSNISWGTGVDGQAILEEIKNSNDQNLADLKGAETADALAKKLQGKEYDSPVARAFAKVVAKHLTDNKTAISKDGANLGAGYYLIKDTTQTENDDVANISILQLTGTADNIKIKKKIGKPSPDKEVEDEVDEAVQGVNKFGETADHSIGESFKFKLTASGFSTADIEPYTTYYLSLNDTMSKGLAFDQIDSVEVQVGNDVITLNESQYTLSGTPSEDGSAESSFKIEISDLKSIIGNKTGDITVTAIYTAHLTEYATVTTATGDILNNNKLNITFSNNPNNDSKGTSTDDYVFVATFKLTNTKVDGDKKPLEGAGFKLLRTETVIDPELGEVTTNYVAKFETKTVEGNVVNVFTGWEAYDDTDENEANHLKNKGTQLVSGENGDFSMTGLDAGTYTLKETQTPDGYDTVSDKVIIIDAEHYEKANNQNQAEVKLSSKSTLTNQVINTKNGRLPETGGMGTTALYAVGTILVAGAAVTFVTNKRMKRD